MMKRHHLSLTFLMFFFLGMFAFLQMASAQEDLEAAKRRKMRQLKKQVKCLLRCYNRAYKRFFRCRTPRATFCNLKADMYLRACIARCSASWFCRGFRKTQRSCPARCLNTARKEWLKKHRWRYYRGKKIRRRIRRKTYLRWRKRSRYACSRVCKSLGVACDSEIIIKLPKPVTLPDLNKM